MLYHGRKFWLSRFCHSWKWSNYWRKASIKDHTSIGDGAIIGAGSGVAADVEAGKTMLGYPAVEARDALKQWAILKRLANNQNK